MGCLWRIAVSVLLLLSASSFTRAQDQYGHSHAHPILRYRSKYNLSHLHQPTLYYAGPLQNDEALLLFAIITVATPKTLVEFGFYAGDSARNALHAMAPDARLYSYDPYDAYGNGKKYMDADKRFKFYQRPGEQFTPADIDNRPIDMVFIDANHDPRSSMAFFKAITRKSSPRDFTLYI